MLIRKRPPRPTPPGTPFRHENHPRPVTRRDFLAAGMLGAQGMVIGSAWLGALLKAQNARAAGLDADISALLAQGQCNVPSGSGSLPFIVFDLAGGANLVGSEALVGVQGGQANFLSTAGYGKLGVPGNMVPTSSTFVSSALGLLWHSDGAILRGILTKAAATTQAGTNGAVIPAMSQNDTQSNTTNPIYGIAEAGAKGTVVNLVGSRSSVSGGNSQALMYTIQPSLQPTTIQSPSDAIALAPVPPGGGAPDPLAIAELESETRISTGTALYQGSGSSGSEFTGALANPSGSTPGVQLVPGGGGSDAALKNQVRCAYVKAANTANIFAAGPAGLDPTQDPLIVGGTTPIFTATDFQNQDVRMTASIMKLVIDGYAGAGTVTLGGYDYHDGSRATGETKNFTAGQMIGAVLEYAARKNTPVMIQIMSDGSLSANSMVDTSTAGRNKLGWQGDNSAVAATVFLVFSPNGRPALRNGVAGQQIGYFTSDGSVVSSSSPAANSINQIPELIMLNYMGLMGTDAQFASTFPMQGLGSAAALAAMTVFEPII
ncbi:MAG TPA: hypothetical protein VEG26_07060 [Steroidobacteraceae bacterium]|nr:hypothetical protein [Steroidobacteraceae bacterium]